MINECMEVLLLLLRGTCWDTGQPSLPCQQDFLHLPWLGGMICGEAKVVYSRGSAYRDREFCDREFCAVIGLT